ncbi:MULTISPECIES: sensor histidine kinase [Rhodomicrobium]|uniref:sensor histidine kinase n=1 Tax=Rhodomicrobium TaxID=1068 RepID=UPI000B4BE2D3|nr:MULTISPECIES: sensor histidine kinase [Rhodomicrobium]
MELATSRTSPSEERLLMRELTHRINNELASAAGMISLAASRSENAEAKATLAAVMERLENYTSVHRALQMPEQSTAVDVAAYLRQLCRSISRSKLDRRNISLVLTEHPVVLDSERCWLLGMIVYELITNAARHAFDGDNGGEVRVEVAMSGAVIQCRVSDDGTAQREVRPGRGLRIIKDLAACLGGRFQQHFGAQGSAAAVVFPAER